METAEKSVKTSDNQDKKYTISNFAMDTYGVKFEQIDMNMQNTKQVMLVGASGTGKTTIALNYVRAKAGRRESKYFDIISAGNSMTAEMFEDILRAACDTAGYDTEHNYYLIIDNIDAERASDILSSAQIGLSHRDTNYLTQRGQQMRVPRNLCFMCTVSSNGVSSLNIDGSVLDRFATIEVDPVWEDGRFKSDIGEIIGAHENDWYNPKIGAALQKICYAVGSLNKGFKRNNAGRVIGTRAVFKKFKTVRHFYEAYTNELMRTAKSNVHGLESDICIQDGMRALEEVEAMLKRINQF